MKRLVLFLLVAVALILNAPNASAHFGMLIADQTMVTDPARRTVHLTLSFSHPFEQVGMQMARPASFAMAHEGRITDLTAGLAPAQVMDHAGWQADVAIRRPGVYTFFFEPQPYWEPAEDIFIAHYTKTVVAAFGQEEGWDRPVGLKTEIVPLTRPFGLYAGNLFRGKVLVDGKPAAGCTVEVEYFNQGGRIQAPNDYFVTQSVTTDAQGIFAVSVPAAGWWGFSALNTAKEKKMHDGQPKEVELGAVLWVRFDPWPAAGR